LSEKVEILAERLVKEALVTMFRKLHPEKAGWNLSLVNLAVTNMSETAGDSKTASGRDISTMFRRQEDVLKDFRVVESDTPSPGKYETTSARDEHQAATSREAESHNGNSTFAYSVEQDPLEDAEWDDGIQDEDARECCGVCGMHVPSFAMGAHRRFHSQPA
jgi:DNA polymerase iota